MHKLKHFLQYDKSFTHGISAATGSPFQEPQETRRMDGNPDVWEGLCGSCNDWVALVSSKKKGTTWFRHAYKVSFHWIYVQFRSNRKSVTNISINHQCHTHPKIKDAPKRRRESSHTRALGASNMAKPPPRTQRLDNITSSPLQEPMTPQMSTVSVTSTPTPGLMHQGKPAISPLNGFSTMI